MTNNTRLNCEHMYQQQATSNSTSTTLLQTTQQRYIRKGSGCDTIQNKSAILTHGIMQCSHVRGRTNVVSEPSMRNKLAKRSQLEMFPKEKKWCDVLLISTSIHVHFSCSSLPFINRLLPEVQHGLVIVHNHICTKSSVLIDRRALGYVAYDEQ